MSRLLKYIFVFAFVLGGLSLCAQSVQYTIKGKLIVAHVDTDLPMVKVDSIVKSFGFKSFVGIETQTSTKGWQVKDNKDDELILVLDKNQDIKKLPPSFVINEAEIMPVEDPWATWGVNDFKSPGVVTINGLTVFTVDGHLDAEHVYLSGSFNNWSTLNTPMERNKKGWQVSLQLPAGKHLYKFIIDGKWRYDKRNRNKEDDLNGGYNSVYYVYNKTFRLDGYGDAKRAEVAGSFNGWKEVRMKKRGEEFILDMYLSPGTHAYKFVVDGQWIIDPNNRVFRNDGAGNQNSFTSIGDTFYFRLNNHEYAKNVYVAGSFNGWNWSELQMEEDGKGWVLPYVLPPGNYDYKFKVDNNYLIDDTNSIRNGEGDMTNSVLCIEPNTTFKLKGHTGGKEVLLSGSFNGWSNSGYTMKETADGWEISIYLPKGKHLYKFMVDGEWMHDTRNDLWEPNEYGGKNSIVWVE